MERLQALKVLSDILQHILGLSGLQILFLLLSLSLFIMVISSYYYVLTFINYQIFFIRLLLVLIIIIAAIMIFGSSLNPANPIQQKLEKKSWEKKHGIVLQLEKTLLWKMTNNSSVWVKKPIMYHKHLRTIQFGGFSLGWPPVTNRGYCCSSFWPIRKPVVVLLQLVLLFLQPQQNLEVVNILLMVQGTNISHQYEKESLIFPTAFSPNISGT